MAHRRPFNYDDIIDLMPRRPALHCLVDPRLAPGYIGWAFEGVGGLQLGVARRHARRNPPDVMALLDRFAPLICERAERPSGTRAGMIPCGGVLPRVFADRVLLVGDAAGLVSPLTAGGIHTALRYGALAGRRPPSGCAGARRSRRKPCAAAIRGSCSIEPCAGRSIASSPIA